MAYVEHRLIASWAAPMFVNALVADDDAQPLIKDPNNCIKKCQATRNRVSIRLVNDFSELFDARDSAHADSRTVGSARRAARSRLNRAPIVS
jgi:hypothetical protein